MDDDPEIGELLKDILSERDLPSIYFQNPVEAIGFIRMKSSKVDWIITDYQMPEITGLQMIRQIHRFKKLPFLLLSGQISEITDNYKLHEIGRLEKPVPRESLLKTIDDYLLKKKTKKTGKV